MRRQWLGRFNTTGPTGAGTGNLFARTDAPLNFFDSLQNSRPSAAATGTGPLAKGALADHTWVRIAQNHPRPRDDQAGASHRSHGVSGVFRRLFRGYRRHRVGGHYDGLKRPEHVGLVPTQEEAALQLPALPNPDPVIRGVDCPEEGSMCRNVLVPYDEREAISVRVAARKAASRPVPSDSWCDEHGSGRRIVGGSWKISRHFHLEK
jgi:hypothetical protein